MATTTLIKKHMVRPFLYDTKKSKWVQIKKATEFSRSMNPTTEERDYIADEFATTEVMAYKPSESFSITTYKGEADFDLFYELYKERATGSDAQRDFMIVSIFETGTADGETVYYAEKTTATITVNEFNAAGSSISIDINENGTPIIGYVSISADGEPTFTEGELPND